MAPDAVASASAAQIAARLRQNLAKRRIPQHIIFLDSPPLTAMPGGRTDRLRRERHPAPPAAASDIRAGIAAANGFMRRGHDKTTIEDSADAPGATEGRVHHYFRSKGAIFFAVSREAMRCCFEAVEPIVPPPLPARLQRMCEAHAIVMTTTLRFQRGIRQGLEICMRGTTTRAERESLAASQALRNRYQRLFRKVLAEGVESGAFRAPDMPLAGRVILPALNGLVSPTRPAARHGGEAASEAGHRRAPSARMIPGPIPAQEPIGRAPAKA